jgi:hypothetical protein
MTNVQLAAAVKYLTQHGWDVLRCYTAHGHRQLVFEGYADLLQLIEETRQQGQYIADYTALETALQQWQQKKGRVDTFPIRMIVSAAFNAETSTRQVSSEFYIDYPAGVEDSTHYLAVQQLERFARAWFEAGDNQIWSYL